TPPEVGKEVHPAGMTFVGDDHLWVTSTRGNNVQLVNLKTAKVEEAVAVGVAPYTIVGLEGKKYYVSNWGGNPPTEKDAKAVSSGTPIKIDPKTGVANEGTVSVVE